MSFTHKNDGFICEGCGKNVPPASPSCRNHCPFCLMSKHVDIDPGDRANPCGGLMDAIGYELDGQKGVILSFRCRKCRATTKNKAAQHDRMVADDYDRILSLTPPVPGSGTLRKKE